MSVLKKTSMNLPSRDSLYRILSVGAGVGLRVKALKRNPSPKSSPQGRGLCVFKPQNTLTVRIWILGMNGLPEFFLKRKQCHCEEGTNVTGRGDEGIPTNVGAISYRNNSHKL